MEKIRRTTTFIRIISMRPANNICCQLIIGHTIEDPDIKKNYYYFLQKRQDFFTTI